MTTTRDFDPYAPTQIGPKRFVTPEGFLVCQDVPLARTGTMMYAATDGLPIEAYPNGMIRVARDAEDLFHEHTLMSFEGKPITDDHPDEDVTPKNWSRLARGSVFNIRRGEGDDADVLLGDFLVMDARSIQDVQDGKREVSCGYDAHYTQIAPGEGRQTNIIGNHVALVERGRCGPRCAIGDSASAPLSKEPTMATAAPAHKPKPTNLLRTMIRQAVRDAMTDPDALVDETDDPTVVAANDETSGQHIHVHIGGGPEGGAATPGGDAVADPTAVAAVPEDKYEPRFKKIEDSLAGISEMMGKMVPAAPAADADEPTDPDEEDKEAKAKTKDSAALETTFKAVCAQAEVLVPGITFPTFDATTKRKATVDTLCGLRRRALDLVAGTRDGLDVLSVANGGKVIDSEGLKTLDCAATATLFKAAAGTKALLNNRSATSNRAAARDDDTQSNGKPKAPTNLAELNAFNRQRYPAGKTA